VTGAVGIFSVVVVIGASLIDGYQNQSMTEATPAIVSFFRSLDDTMGWLMSYATSVGLIAYLLFTIGLALALRPHERGLPWRSAFLAAAGVVSVVSGQIASWDAAVFRASSIDPQVARYAYDLGNLSFANSWVVAGAVGICAGLVMLRAPRLPRWVAWWGPVAGVGEVLARPGSGTASPTRPSGSTGPGSSWCRHCWSPAASCLGRTDEPDRLHGLTTGFATATCRIHQRSTPMYARIQLTPTRPGTTSSDAATW
jgi:hypothetical protein